MDIKPTAMNASKPTLRYEVDFSSVPPTDMTEMNWSYQRVAPSTSISDQFGDIEFNYKSSDGHLIDLKNSYLHFVVRILKRDGTNITSADKVAPVNNFLSSLVQDAVLFFKEDKVSDSKGLYPYLAIFQAILGFNKSNKEGHLTSELFYDDVSNSTTNNSGWTTRSGYCAESKTIELQGKLALDVCKMPKMVPPSIDLTLKLKRSSPEFCLFMENATSDNLITTPYKIKFESAFWVLRKVEPTATVLTNIDKILSDGKRKLLLEYKQTELRAFGQPQGNYHIHAENVFTRAVPSKLIVTFVSSSSFAGKISENPFYFDHKNLEYIRVYLDNHPIQQINADFDHNQTLEAYNELYQLLPYKTENGLDRKTFAANGKSFFVFNLKNTTGSTFSPKMNGNLSIETKLRKALDAPATMLILGVFDNILNVNKKRETTLEHFP
jgi:hypothetical protein